MTPLTVTIPYPTYAMSGNARIHWQKRNELRQAARFDGNILTKDALGGKRSPFAADDQMTARVTFCPPDRKRRDLDNAFVGVKGHMDGIFEAIGVDDSRLRSVTLCWGEVIANGAVVVELARVEEGEHEPATIG